MASTSRFPDGLRVLVINYNAAWLDDIAMTLRMCNYEGTICGSFEEALTLLKEKKQEFDVVLCGLNNPNNNADDEFQFLEQVAREFDLPIIGVISNEEDIDAMVKKCARHTMNFVVGPAIEKDLMILWQHVYRRRLWKASAANHKDGDLHENNNNNNTALVVVEEEKRPIITAAAAATCNSQEKQKLVWTEELHQEFVRAVERTGVPLDKVTPKQILKEMNIPGITRDHISSHLQKYRKSVKDEAARKDLQQRNIATSAAATSTSSAPPRNHHRYDAPINDQQPQIVPQVVSQDCAQQILMMYHPQVNQEGAPPSVHVPDQVINQESAVPQQIVNHHHQAINHESAHLLGCAPPSVNLPDQVINQESALLRLDCAQHNVMYHHPQAVNQESAHLLDCAPLRVPLQDQAINQESVLRLDHAQHMMYHHPQAVNQQSAHLLDFAPLSAPLQDQVINQESVLHLDFAQHTMYHHPQAVNQASARCLGGGARQMGHLPQLIDQECIRCFVCCAQLIMCRPYLDDPKTSLCSNCARKIMRDVKSSPRFDCAPQNMHHHPPQVDSNMQPADDASQMHKLTENLAMPHPGQVNCNVHNNPAFPVQPQSSHGNEFLFGSSSTQWATRCDDDLTREDCDDVYFDTDALFADREPTDDNFQDQFPKGGNGGL